MRRLLWAVTLLVVGCAAEPPAQRAIIDMHLHAYPADFFGGLGVPDPVFGHPSPETDDALLRQTVAAMDEHGIKLGLISGPLDYVARWKAAEPQKFLGSPQFPHPYPYPDLETLRALHDAGELAALGEVTTQYVGVSPNDEELEPYLALAEELDIPVGIHMSTCSAVQEGVAAWAPECRVSLGRPTQLEEALVRHPNLRVWIMHAGFPYLEDTIAVMSVYTQVYADLSALNWFWPTEDFQRYIRRLMDAGLGKRLMFGSDQSIWPEMTIPRSIATIESATFLTEQEKRDILCFNAARFLKIDDEICASEGPAEH